MTLNEFKHLKPNDVVYYYYDRHIPELTLNKEYNIIEIDDEYYFVVINNDRSYIQIYDFQLFATLNEFNIIHRNDKIKKLLK